MVVAASGCGAKATPAAAGPTTTAEPLPSPYDIGCRDFMDAAAATRRGAVPSMSATIDVPPSAELPDLVEQGCTDRPDRSVGVIIHDKACGVVTPDPEPTTVVPAPTTVVPPTTVAPTTGAPSDPGAIDGPGAAPPPVAEQVAYGRAGGGSGGGRTSAGRTGNGHANGGTRSGGSGSGSGSSSSNRGDDDDDPTPTTRATHTYQGCGQAR